MRRSTIRGAVSIALLALTTIVIPSPAGAFEVMNTKGNPGPYKVKDTLSKPGVVCRFEDHIAPGDEELDRVRVRPLRMRGTRPGLTWVGYRFSVLQRQALEEDYEFVHRSKVAKKMASASDPVRFPWRAWRAPEDLAASDFRVLIDLFHYRAGSKTKVRGKVRGVLEVYRHTHPAEAAKVLGAPGDGGECIYWFWS